MRFQPRYLCSGLGAQHESSESAASRVVLSYLKMRRVEMNLNRPCRHQPDWRRTRRAGTMLPQDRLGQWPILFRRTD
jgi:hypothetical protein